MKVVFSFDKEHKKRKIQDFVAYFNNRYNALKKILMNRKELDNPVSIARLAGSRGKEEVAVIGIITEKQITKNGNVIFTIEDPTDQTKVLINKNKPEQLEIAKDCILDEVIGITGNMGDNIIFANNIFYPDIPLSKELKKTPDEVYVAFISDFHFGSKVFLHEPFNKFIKWIQGESGSAEQKALAAKIKYIFLVGDLVEGIGIYPGQYEDLEVVDIHEQYKLFSNFLKKIPSDKKIIISP